MVSVCLPSDALLQHLPSYLGFSYLGRGVSLLGCSSKAQPLLLTLDEGYLLTTTLPDLHCGIAPLSPPVPAQPRLLGPVIGPPGHCPWPRVWVAPPGRLRLFNLYAEYIMRKAGLEEAQARIKIAGRNINNLKYADDTTLWKKVKKN